MKKAGYALAIITMMFCIFICGFLVGRNANRSSITMVDPLPTSNATTEASKKININTASIDDLTLLPGIGHSIAQRIVDYRNTVGPFRTVSDLTDVEGISDQKLVKLLDYITI